MGVKVGVGVAITFRFNTIGITGGNVIPPTPVMLPFLLLESGDPFLFEDGTEFLLETYMP